MDEVEQIKERLDIVEIISNYLTLKKAGAHFKAPCPFHNEKTPSFMVSQERQTFKCFGCGEGGDIFTFIEKMEGVDFYNALKILADKAGIELKNQSVQFGKKEYKSDRKTRIFEINDWAKKVYCKILLDHPKADHARKYLRSRGMSQETINEFEIGYAPDSWDFLIRFLKSKNYTEEEMLQAGVAIRSEKGSYYDRFRGRIIFPINNIMGLTVAFTSRILKDDKSQAKYINSAESPIYIKGKTIYGLDKAKLAVKEDDLVVMVEGNMDVIACHQAGFKNVVATSGTAITEDQLKILSRYASEIAFSFDHDKAGETAMKRAIKMALANDITTKIISISGPYKDPDEAIKADSKNWQRAVEAAKPSLEYWIDLLIKQNPDLGVSTKKKIAKEILPVIKIIFSDIEKEYYIKYLAGKLAISEKAIIAALEKTKTEQLNNHQEPKEEKKLSLKLEEKVLGLVWLMPEAASEIKELENFELADKIFDDYVAMIRSKRINPEAIDPQTKNQLNQYSLVASEGFNLNDKESIYSEIKYLCLRLKSDRKEQIKNDFAMKIKQAEESGDKAKLKSLLSEFSSLIK